LYPKAQITPTVVQKMLLVVQKNAIHLFNFERYVSNRRPMGDRMLAEQRIHAQRKDNYENLRRMPSKAGIRYPLP
jgi:hypothetical protein